MGMSVKTMENWLPADEIEWHPIFKWIGLMWKYWPSDPNDGLHVTHPIMWKYWPSDPNDGLQVTHPIMWKYWPSDPNDGL